MPSEKEHRNKQLAINLEPSFFALVSMVAASEGFSNSEYGRNLIIRDLINRKIIDAHMLADIITGRTLDKIKAMISAGNVNGAATIASTETSTTT